MQQPELEQLKMLAEVDELIDRLKAFSEADGEWAPANNCRNLLRRLLGRVQTLRVRLESPLVVATFGGTGTGKSTLVNALVGREVSQSGRQRPTTTRPILIAHPETELEPLNLPLEQFEVKQVASAILRDIVVIDCPDPDTSETSEAGSNTAILREMLPHCDVLLYVSTQQKYQSARVIDELADAAAGCRLVFVQTHADVDSDIRDDWRKRLEGKYDVPEMFFVDSMRAMKEQQAGQRPSGDFSRLQSLLTTQLSASHRVQVRRANLIDLIHSALNHCQTKVTDDSQHVVKLREILEEQRAKLTSHMATQLREELLVSRNLWERRLLTSVTDHWGFSPFSAILRFYNGIGGFIASFTLFRARTSAQMALIGAMQGAKWVAKRVKEQTADGQLDRIASFGLSDNQLQESQFVIAGYLRSAGMDPELIDRSSIDSLRHQAARVEDQFLGDARRKVDTIIEDLAVKNTGWFTRWWYEILFLAYIAFVLVRVGRNFFYDSMFVEDSKLLSTDFYIPAAIFFALWSAVLVMAFTMRLRRGLQGRIRELADELASFRIASGLFPGLERACQRVERDRGELDSLVEMTTTFRNRLAGSESNLGGRAVEVGTESN
ncbi:MAG: dynamin family protein [Planctomycetaceae bacterium]